MVSVGKWVLVWFLALIVLGAGVLVRAESVQSRKDTQTPVVIAQSDTHPGHVVEGHLDHCHGGSFCSGAVVMSAALASPDLYLSASRVAVAEHDFRVLGPLGFDPPPPRPLS